jgi:Ni/Fe-hydrogenase subunit HybB-like protein
MSELADRCHDVTEDAVRMFTWTRVGWLVYWGAVGVCGYAWLVAALFWSHQMSAGLQVTGLAHPVMWGAYITTFVFWIGLAHSGTFVSAILFLCHARWRISIARAAETMTIAAIMTAVLFPVVHLGRAWRFYWLVPYPNERGLWINFSSPLVWDAFAIGTYFMVSVLFWYLSLVPDFALLRDRSAGWPRVIFGRLALGWAATSRQWRSFRAVYGIVAALITALVVSVHSIVSWDFAAAIVPGWHSTIFAPYFVAAAILSGLSMVLTLVIPARALLGAQKQITIDHLENIAKLIVAMSIVVTYVYVMEAIFSLRGNPYERSTFLLRVSGRYWPLFWTTVMCVSLAPLTLLVRSLRRRLAMLMAVSLIVNVGMWLERFMIIVTSLAHDFDPYAWGTYRPSALEWTIIGGSVAWFLFWYLLLMGHIPPVPIADAKQNLLETAGLG